jgi:hypothetical protein
MMIKARLVAAGLSPVAAAVQFADPQNKPGVPRGAPED